MRKTGRTSKLTPAVHEAIVNAVRLGVPVVSAAAYVGIEQRTVLEWIARGEGRHPRGATSAFAQFAQQIQKARSEDEVRRISRLEEAAQGGQVVYEKTTTYPDGHTVHEVRRTRPEWTVDAWFLERSRPEAWGRRQQIDVRANIEKMAGIVAEELGISAAEVLEEAQRLLKESDERP